VKEINRCFVLAILGACFSLLVYCPRVGAQATTRPIVLKGAFLIDGTGRPAVENSVLIIEGDKIRAAGKAGSVVIPKDADVRDMSGKTIMPALVSLHGHPGVSAVNGVDAAVNYTQEDVLRQLQKYLAYGVGTVVSLGEDEDLVYTLRDAQHAHSFGGARLYTAGRGFASAGGRIAPGDVRYHPKTPDEARANVDELAPHHPDVMKMWMDSRWQPDVYKALIDEGHRHQLRILAHEYYLAEAKALLAAGIDGFAHSIRDVPVDQEIVDGMKARGVFLIPTLVREEVVFVYADEGTWVDNPFFQAGLEPGVLETLRSSAFIGKFRQDPDLAKYKAGLEMAKKNLKTLYDAGIKIGFGTDSGIPTRFPGYLEHRELQLMVEAGLTPMQAIVIATSTSAGILNAEQDFGSLQPGRQADFMVLNANPLQNIHNTEKLSAVWQAGKAVPSVPASQAASKKQE
jgi:imidazolonepropionase-like amidohydrolase